MIRTSEVSDFFDRLAPGWDAGMRRNDEIISMILDNAGITVGNDVLDVACGTGVLIPDYLERKVSSVTGIDLSQKMIEIARNRFRQENVSFVCGDASFAEFDRRFDSIVVYNALPHIADPEQLISHLAASLKPSGKLTIAHGKSREQINEHHRNLSTAIAHDLMPAEELALLFEKYLSVTEKIDDAQMYLVVGQK